MNRKLQEIQKTVRCSAVQCQNRDWKNNQISKSLTKCVILKNIIKVGIVIVRNKVGSRIRKWRL